MSLVKRVSDGRRVAKPTQAPHAGASYTVRALRVLSFCDLFLCPPAYCCSYFALKRMDKKKIILMKQLEHIHNEKELLASVDHPFVIKLCALPLPVSVCAQRALFLLSS